VASKQPIILTDEIVPPPALIRAGLDALPSIIRARGERANRRFIEFFTANVRNRNTRMAYARGATSASSGSRRSIRSASLACGPSAKSWSRPPAAGNSTG
jgi:hypothetical protein